MGLALALLACSIQALAVAQGIEQTSSYVDTDEWWSRTLQFSGEQDHTYKMGERVRVEANTIGPFSNPETYEYYILSLCPPTQNIQSKSGSLGGMLQGERLVNTPYDIRFRVDEKLKKLCSQELTSKDLDRLRNAIGRDYTSQMFIDDLPSWAFLGKTGKLMKPGEIDLTRWYLFTHIHFDILYHKDWVIEVAVSTDPELSVDITEKGTIAIDFSYSVNWRETEIPFGHRMDKFSKNAYLPQNMRVHWIGIINSSVVLLVLFLMLANILLTIFGFNHKTEAGNDDAAEKESQTGWKGLHGDVFRPPYQLNLFAACVGTGTQILAMVVAILTFALAGTFPAYNRGVLPQTCVVLYALTAGIAGYVSAVTYKMIGGTNRVSNYLLTSTILSGPLSVTFGVLNTIAAFYHSTAAVPLDTIFGNLALWVSLAFLLTFLGSKIGASAEMRSNASILATTIPREVPPLPWYLRTLPQMIIAGLPPFNAIFIELYFATASIWGHKIYSVYPILVVVLVLMIIETAAVVVILSYMRLTKEDHRWWWNSFRCGGSVSLFIFGYTFWFYFCKSNMSGVLQTAYYFGYMAMVSYAFLLMLGAVGFSASLIFVGTLYNSTSQPKVASIEIPTVTSSDLLSEP